MTRREEIAHEIAIEAAMEAGLDENSEIYQRTRLKALVLIPYIDFDMHNLATFIWDEWMGPLHSTPSHMEMVKRLSDYFENLRKV